MGAVGRPRCWCGRCGRRQAALLALLDFLFPGAVGGRAAGGPARRHSCAFALLFDFLAFGWLKTTAFVHICKMLRVVILQLLLLLLVLVASATAIPDKLTAFDAARYDYFGNYLHFFEDVLAVSSIQDDDIISNSGDNLVFIIMLQLFDLSNDVVANVLTQYDRKRVHVSFVC